MSVDLTLSWPSGDHPLLQGAALAVTADNVAVSARVTAGTATVAVPDGTTDLQLTLTFTPAFGGRRAEVLRIDQYFRSPFPGSPLSEIQPVEFEVLSGPEQRRRRVPGLHPLLLGVARGAVTPAALPVRTSLVDVSKLLAGPFAELEQVTTRSIGGAAVATVRILARTDGTFPRLWIVATPYACRGAAATDVLGFLGPSQNHDEPPSLDDQLSDRTEVVKLLVYAAAMLGSGAHPAASVAGTNLRDHFLDADVNPKGFLLAKGLARAVVDSGKHAILAVPVPARRSHNAAATRSLRALLADVHRFATAAGDAHPPVMGDAVHTAEVDSPQYAIAAHSRGALALWGEPDPGQSGPHARSTVYPGALRGAAKGDYTDLFLFEPLYASAHLDALAGGAAKRVVFIGFDPKTVSGPSRIASGMPSLAGRVARLPVTPPGEAPAETAALSALEARSPSLQHALSTLSSPPTGSVLLFALKHQACTWSGDRAGVAGGPELHYLRQALGGSGLRP